MFKSNLLFELKELVTRYEDIITDTGGDDTGFLTDRIYVLKSLIKQIESGKFD